MLYTENKDNCNNSHNSLGSGFSCVGFGATLQGGDGIGGLDCAKDPFVDGVATFWSAPSDFPAVIPTSFPMMTVGNSPEFAALDRGIVVATGTTSSGNSSTTITSVSGSTASNSNAGSSGAGGGLPTSGKIALGVSVPLFVIILIPVAFVFRRRRKAASSAAAATAPEKTEDLPAHFGRSELWAGRDAVPVEADSREVQSDLEPVEADGHPTTQLGGRQYELPA
jgi:hypothetical protein